MDNFVLQRQFDNKYLLWYVTVTETNGKAVIESWTQDIDGAFRFLNKSDANDYGWQFCIESGFPTNAIWIKNAGRQVPLERLYWNVNYPMGYREKG